MIGSVDSAPGAEIATESRKLTIAMRAWIAAGLILDRQELDANLKTISDTEASQSASLSLSSSEAGLVTTD